MIEMWTSRVYIERQSLHRETSPVLFIISKPTTIDGRKISQNRHFESEALPVLYIFYRKLLLTQ